MIAAQGLRMVRTTLLGYMPGWCPEIHVAGPWRPISLLRPKTVAIHDLSLRAELTEEGEGLLQASLRVEGEAESIVLRCAGRKQGLVKGSDGSWGATLKIPGVQPWWPLSH